MGRAALAMSGVAVVTSLVALAVALMSRGDAQVTVEAREVPGAASTPTSAASAPVGLETLIDQRIEIYHERQEAQADADSGDRGAPPSSFSYSGGDLTGSFGAGPIDVSGLDDVDAKLKRIVESFKGQKSYRNDDPRVQQMISLGREGVEPLLAMLSSEEFGGFENWMTQRVLEDALSGLLTAEDEATILTQYERHGHFSELIKEHQFPAAEDLVMAKLAGSRVDRATIDAALLLNSERAVPALAAYVAKGQNVSHAAEQLDDIPDLDLTQTLVTGAASASNVWDQASFARLMLERGLPGGLPLAARVLRSNEPHVGHLRGRIAELVSRLTPADGTTAELAAYLEANAENLEWNPSAGVFQ